MTTNPVTIIRRLTLRNLLGTERITEILQHKKYMYESYEFQ